MNSYRKLIDKSEKCSNKALNSYRRNEIKLATFFNNASNVFKQRALNVLTSEVI